MYLSDSDSGGPDAGKSQVAVSFRRRPSGPISSEWGTIQPSVEYVDD